MPKLENPVLMAVIGAAHGIRGDVRVKAYTADPLGLAGYGPLADASGRLFTIASLRPQGEVMVAKIQGITDRTAAEALTGTELYIDRARLPDADEDEFYHADLVGLSVRDETGGSVGTVTAIHNFGAGDIMEATVDGRRGVLLPFSRAAVPEIDVKAGFVRIDREAAGLTETEEKDGPPREDREP